MNIIRLNQEEVSTVSGGFFDFNNVNIGRATGGILTATAFMLLDRDPNIPRRVFKWIFVLSANWFGTYLGYRSCYRWFCINGNKQSEDQNTI